MEEYIRAKYERKMFQGTVPFRSSTPLPFSASGTILNESLLASLQEMGFGGRNRCAEALLTSNGDISMAIEILSTASSSPTNSHIGMATISPARSLSESPQTSTCTLLTGSPSSEPSSLEGYSGAQMKKDKLEELITVLEGMGFKNRNVRNPKNLADSYLGSALIYKGLDLEATINELVEHEEKRDTPELQAPQIRPEPCLVTSRSRRTNVVPFLSGMTSQKPLQWRGNFGEGESLRRVNSKDSFEHPESEEFGDFISSSTKKPGDSISASASSSEDPMLLSERQKDLVLSPFEAVTYRDTASIDKNSNLTPYDDTQEDPKSSQNEFKPLLETNSEHSMSEALACLEPPQWGEEHRTESTIRVTSSLSVSHIDEGNSRHLPVKKNHTNVDGIANTNGDTTSDHAVKQQDIEEKDPFADLINL